LGRGEVGGRAALPAWISFMETALHDIPEQPLEKPAGVVSVRIDPRTGTRAASNQEDAIFEVFRSGNIPQEGGPSMTIGEPFGEGAATPGEQGSTGGDLF
jgi:penicillin-binding protein 1A